MKVLIIGYSGRVAKRHIKAWHEMGVDVYGVSSQVDYKSALTQQYDIIDICTPIYLHGEMIKECVKHAKKVICEKPLALTVEEAQTLLSYEQVCIVHQFRFNPKILALRKDILAGKYGEIKIVTANYFRYRDQSYYQKWEWDKFKAGGGVLFNVCIHYVDLMQWIFGYPVDVAGFTTTSKKGLDVEDNVVAMMRFPTGAIGSLNLSTDVNPPKHFELSVYGSEGHTTIQLRHNEYHKENFQAYLAGKEYVNPREAFKSLQICHDIYNYSNGKRG